MRTLMSTVVAGATALLMFFVSPSASAEIRAKSVCDLLNEVQNSQGKKYRLRAQLETDFQHYSHLRDTRCPGSRLVLLTTDAFNSSREGQQFNNALSAASIDDPAIRYIFYSDIAGTLGSSTQARQTRQFHADRMYSFRVTRSRKRS
jgi:hypothetical protein